jgi:hypothetical protein
MRVVVVANEAVSGRELSESLVAHLGDGPGSVFVVAPALIESGLKYQLGDVDDAIEPARQRLQRTLEELRAAGIDAEGEVGDSDPMVAIGDEMQKIQPDRVLVVGHRDEDGVFAERGLLEQMQRDLDLPVTELVVEKGKSSPHVLDIERTDPGAGRGKGWRPSANLPPLSRLDVAGIVVAVVGTLLLGVLAAKCMGHEGGFDAACAARVLIAVAVALVNLAHVVGLLLFQSVGYEGIWSRFFARLSLIGTPTAVAVSLLLGLWM